jgi:hypothetical protein
VTAFEFEMFDKCLPIVCKTFFANYFSHAIGQHLAYPAQMLPQPLSSSAGKMSLAPVSHVILLTNSGFNSKKIIFIILYRLLHIKSTTSK